MCLWTVFCFSVKHEKEEMASAKFSLMDPGIVHKGYRYQPVQPVMLEKVGPILFLPPSGMIKKMVETEISNSLLMYFIQRLVLKFQPFLQKLMKGCHRGI